MHVMLQLICGVLTIFLKGCGQFLNELHELANPTQDAALGQTNWIESSSSSNASLYIKTSSGVDIKWKNSKLIKPSTSNSTKPLATVGCSKLQINTIQLKLYVCDHLILNLLQEKNQKIILKI